MHSARSTQTTLCTLHSDCSLLCARSTQTADCFVHAPLRLQTAGLQYSRLQSAALYSTLSIHSTVLKPWRNYNNKLLKTPRLSLFKDFVTVALWYRVSLQGYLTRVRIPLRVPSEACRGSAVFGCTDRGMPRGISGSEACRMPHDI